MFISDFAIKRPIVTVVSMLALVVFGTFALFQLEVDEFPEINPPVISVSLPFPGASPDQVEEYATGGKGLLHLGGGTYQFNWATPKSYAGSCKTATLTAYDAELTAQFQFRK